MRRVRIKVSGVVQGVGFRFFTRTAARQSGVRGFVRNLPDGRVEIEAESGEESLNDFINKVKKGPSSARVTGIELEDMVVNGWTGGFEIRF